ncbi:MAG: hypothetical protein B5M56_01205 [Desulfococcus sp. 4484_241]|nr:MAG: hypothetical protein B5M56_01205 [Desulfococcus sp. 4484_241]
MVQTAAWQLKFCLFVIRGSFVVTIDANPCFCKVLYTVLQLFFLLVIAAPCKKTSIRADIIVVDKTVLYGKHGSRFWCMPPPVEI